MNRKSLLGLMLSGWVVLLCNSLFDAHAFPFILSSNPPSKAWLNAQSFADGLWLYVPSTGAVPRYVADMNPFFRVKKNCAPKLDPIEPTNCGRRSDRVNLGQPARWQQGAPV